MESPESLESLSFFRDLDPADRNLLASIANRRDYAAGTVIFAEGDRPESIRVLESGIVSLRQKQKNAPGDLQMTNIHEPGSVFGVAALVGEEHIYPHSAVCLEKTRVIELEGERLLGLFKDEPEAGVRILLRFAQYLSSRLTGAREQIRSRLRRGLISHG